MSKSILPDIHEEEFLAKAEKEITSLKEEVRHTKSKVKIYAIITIIVLVTINVMLIFVGSLWTKTQINEVFQLASEELTKNIEDGIKEDVRQRITQDILKEYAVERYLPEDYTTIGVYADTHARPSVVQVLCGMSQITVRATGVILNSDGYVLTNTHVVTHKTEIPSGDGVTAKYEAYEKIRAVIHGSNNEYPMTLVAYNPDIDLAIIKFDNTPSGLTPAVLTNSDFVKRGEEVALIGNTIGYGLTTTTGAVSGAYTHANTDFILTDALALTGTSGAGLFNVYSELVGVISMQLFSEQSGSMAGAVSSNEIIDYIEKINSQLVDGKPVYNITYTLSNKLPDTPAS